MKKLLLLSVYLIVLPLAGSAQVGITAGYVRLLTASEWFDAVGESTRSSLEQMPGWQVGLDYWWRLKKKRIEFTAEGNFLHSDSELLNIGEMSLDMLALQLNTNLYPFDFGNDCNCPTWSNTGNAFSKGLFAQLIAGVVYNNQQYSEAGITLDDSQITFRLGAGVGLDIGVSDFFTITPLFRYLWHSEAKFNDLAQGGGVVKTTVEKSFFGVRLGLRLDKLRRW